MISGTYTIYLRADLATILAYAAGSKSAMASQGLEQGLE
jgi:hypothetical protein